jgi:uncharacterized protein (DUF849 family)
MTPTIIMVAPNGARKTRHDHPNLPLSIEETVDEAQRCFEAGASVLHAHVRGSEDEHVLDAGRYRELLAEMTLRVPRMLLQITSEAVGRYNPQEQVACIQAVKPTMTSMALREITSDFRQLDVARAFFEWCVEAGVHLQHIVYSAEELDRFVEFRRQGIIPQAHRCVLFVLGRYAADFQSDPNDLIPFLERDLSDLDWFTCAFGTREQACVMSGIEAGGHARVGFENNLTLPDGGIADSSAALVSSLSEAILAGNRRVAAPRDAAQLLGIRSA